MSFKVDSEQIRAAIEKLNVLGDRCEESYNNLNKIPESSNDKGRVHEALCELCGSLCKTYVYLAVLIQRSKQFLTTAQETFDKADKQSAGNICDWSESSAPFAKEVRQAPRETTTPVKLQGQNTIDTCGAASANMILNSLGVNVSEEDIWKYENSNGQGTYVYRQRDALNHYLGTKAYQYVDTSRMKGDEYYKLISNSLKKGYPVQVVMSVPKDSAFGYSVKGHYVVITGVYRNKNGEYIAQINDPYSKEWYSNGHQGQKVEVKLSDVQQYNKNHSGYIICS